MSRPPSPNNCCIKPENPWVPDSSGNYPRGACNCDCSCQTEKNLLLKVRSASPPRNIPISENIAYLDSKAIAFSNSSGSVQRALNAALITPSSYAGSVGVIFSQDAAAAANEKNLQNTLVPQAASVAAAYTAIATTKASRLAYRSLTEATNALNSINILNLNELASLVTKAKLAADALVNPSYEANQAAQAVASTASSITENANTKVASSKQELTEIECKTATAICNSVSGSSQQRITYYERVEIECRAETDSCGSLHSPNLRPHKKMIDIATGKANLDVLVTAAEKALSAERAANAVAVTTRHAYIGALEARDTANVANTFFVRAASDATSAADAFSAYKTLQTNDNLVYANFASRTAALSKALLPPLQKLKDLVAATSAASDLANTAASNARTLSSSLDIEAKRAAAPLYNSATPQMIAKQTAAAERFGAAAAAAASRAARESAAPPKPPFIPIPRNSVYNVRIPERSTSNNRRLAEARTMAAVKAMSQNPRIHRYCQ